MKGTGIFEFKMSRNEIFRMQKKVLSRILIVLCLMFMVFISFKMDAQAKRDVVIVIDPGHGGTNLGAKHNGVIEKEVNMKVAIAMKEELEKYDGVVVYLTRSGDDSMELIERAQFARDVKADIIISLHFNMSEMHDLHGSEMWVSSQGGLRQEAERYAKINQMLLSEYGIEKRGCFTRLNDLGSDYYGIIRESANYGIPAVIVEHCYLDRPEEYGFYDTDAALDRLGRIDATAVAMAYNLSSETLGVDYTRHYISNTKLPEGLLDADATPPDEVLLDIVDFNENNNQMKAYLKVDDSESTMVYYQYSYNGGKTFSDPKPIYADTEVEFTVPAYPSAESGFVVRAYNAYGLYTDSEIYDLNLILFNIKEPVIRQDSIISAFITDIMDEIEAFADELPEEVKKAATVVLIIGCICGLGSMFALFMHQRKGRKALEEYQSEAKGA